MFFRLPAFFLLDLLPNTASFGQQPAPAKETKPKEEGIPVTDPLTVARCGACHKQDDKGSMTRISWDRTTPEGWEQAIQAIQNLTPRTCLVKMPQRSVKKLHTLPLPAITLSPEQWSRVHTVLKHDFAGNS